MRTRVAAAILAVCVGLVCVVGSAAPAAAQGGRPLRAVLHDASLTGDGDTVPLSVVASSGPPLITYFDIHAIAD